MPRYFIYFSYNGTRYHGWQIQPNAHSVQEEVTRAMSLLLHENISLTAAGRTDTGVHASNMVAHFDTTYPISDLDSIRYKLNSFLSHDIAINKIEKVAPDKHARFDATSRTYKYYLTTSKNPFLKEFSAYINFPLDFSKMNEACNVLLGYTDFTSFSKLHTDTKTNNCKIMKAIWKKEQDKWVFTIQADRFLRNMVRAIVGTMIEVGRGKLSVEEFKEIIEKKNRCAAGSSAPAQGLFLVNVSY
jgi:tRNA pseudouridine38-40 synthase